MKEKFVKSLYLLLGSSLLAIVLFSFSSTVYADTYTVTSTADDGGAGTLRWAITNANSHSGPDAINFNLPGGAGTITLGSNLPRITDPVTIDGSGQSVTIDGNANVSTIFWVDSDDTTIENLTLVGSRYDGISFEGVTGGVVRGNSISGCLVGIGIYPNFGSNRSPDEPDDDTLNSSLTITGNMFSNLGVGILIYDDDIGDIKNIASQNTFNNVTNSVLHEWKGAVELLHGYGSHWSAVTSGQVITLTNDCATLQFTKFDKSDSQPNLGVWGPAYIDYDDVYTWALIPEELVDGEGHYRSCGKTTIVTSGHYNGSTVFSFDGNSKTDPVDPDYGLPFTNDKNSTTVGRYQIAQILFEEPPAPVQIPEPSTFMLVIPGIAGIGLWYKMHRQKNM